MFIRLFAAFAIIPVIELVLLIKLGTLIGILQTVAVVIFTAFLGAFLARTQGVVTLIRIRQSLSEGRMPGDELLDALIILIAGIVLLTPGFITDTFGFFLLIPKGRGVIKKHLKNALKTSMSRTEIRNEFEYRQK